MWWITFLSHRQNRKEIKNCVQQRAAFDWRKHCFRFSSNTVNEKSIKLIMNGIFKLELERLREMIANCRATFFM